MRSTLSSGGLGTVRILDLGGREEVVQQYAGILAELDGLHDAQYLTVSLDCLAALLQHVHVTEIYCRVSSVRDHPHVRAVPAARHERPRQAERTPAGGDAEVGARVDGVGHVHHEARQVAHAIDEEGRDSPGAATAGPRAESYVCVGLEVVEDY